MKVGHETQENKAGKDILKDFLAEETARGRRAQGLSGLRNRVPKFLSFADSEGLDLYRVGVQDALRYQGWLLACRKKDGGKYCHRTVVSYLVAVTAFYEYLAKNDLVTGNPFKAIKRVRGEKTLPRNLLREKETESLLDSLGLFTGEETLKRKIRKYRVHVVCELLYSTGLRIAEASALTPEDIDFGASLVRVRDGKGGRARVCFLNSYTRDLLKVYIGEIRPLLQSKWHRDKTTLFLSCRDRLEAVVNGVLREAAEKEKHPAVTCHTFRHLLGYHLLRSGCALRSIQEILGHVSLKNTEIYTRVDKEDLKAVLDSCHPRKWRRAQ
jgi:site-specific recombinase XerD